MARPRIALPEPAAILALVDAQGRLALRVTPGARVEDIALADGKVAVKVRARPDGGAANDAVIALLARAIGRPPSAITLLRGATSREKLVQIAR